MKRSAWSLPTDPETVKRRAAGRRHYNAWRKHKAMYRRWVLVLETANHLGVSVLNHGAQAKIARKLGVSRSTICRDVQAILASWHEEEHKRKPCPLCGHRNPCPVCALEVIQKERAEDSRRPETTF